MTMTNEAIKLLLAKYEEGQCNAEEKALVENWYLKLGAKAPEVEGEPDYAYWNNYIMSGLPVVQKKQFKLWPKVAVAAAALAAIAFGLWFYNTRHLEGSEATKGHLSSAKNDIAPGGNHATLTSNGKSITLSDTKTGLTINAAQLTYNDGTKIDPSALELMEGDSRSMEVITPRGGTYFVILQDGTRVWLNADSKLEFPSDFRNVSQRTVKLEGEAYFEVAKNKAKPFIVKTTGQEVQVLGTHFNINSYANEPAMKTTLLEGSVRVGNDIILKPGQQAVSTGVAIKVNTVNTAEAVAWKNGNFQFDNTELKAVLRQLARWYDVDIKYEGEIPERNFTGYIGRNLNASEALDILKYLKVDFRISGKSIIVSANKP